MAILFTLKNKIPLKILKLLLIILIAVISYVLWTWELHSERNILIYLKYPFRQNNFFPISAIPISFLSSLTLILTLSIFSKSRRIRNYIFSLVIFFIFNLISFYVFRWSLVEISLRGWVKSPIFSYLLAIFIIIPLYSLVTRTFINILLIRTKKSYLLWLWIAIMLTIPLSLFCLFLFDRHELTNNWYILTSVQKGYPLFWIQLTIPCLTYLYLVRQEALISK